jgi:hypothetical protein
MPRERSFPIGNQLGASQIDVERRAEERDDQPLGNPSAAEKLD